MSAGDIMGLAASVSVSLMGLAAIIWAAIMLDRMHHDRQWAREADATAYELERRALVKRIAQEIRGRGHA